MSSPSTPARSVAGSTASTPGSSSKVDMLQLTPRSKIKAMMAAIDDNSDDEALTGSGISLSRSVLQLPNVNTDKINVATAGSSIGADDHDDSSEDEEIVMPRGKLAARLQNRKTRVESPAPEDVGLSRTGDEPPRPAVVEAELSSPNGGEVENASEGLDQTLPPIAKPPVKGRFLLRKKIQPVVPEHASESTPTSRSDSPLRDPLSPMPESLDPSNSTHESSDADMEHKANPDKKARFLALVTRKREERQAKEAAEEQKRSERQAATQALTKNSARGRASSFSEDGTEDEDIEVGDMLTQQSRPSRKASKKALEEMSRETQRLSRNMQLAHECKVKKKFTVADYLERFKKNKPALKKQSAPSSAANSSLPGSDVETSKEQQTPPTSPLASDTDPKPLKAPYAPVHSPSKGDPTIVGQVLDESLPSLDDIYSGKFATEGKGKGKAIARPQHDQTEAKQATKKPLLTQRPIKIYPPKNPVAPAIFGQDSDSDLEIVPNSKPNGRKLDIFDKLPAKKASDGKTLRKLRALAHLSSPGKKMNAKSSMTATELQISLQKRARQQAAVERAEKIQSLKDRGIIVQTVEEREREQVQVEDMLEKARQAADELTKREKAAAKKQAQENGEELEITSDEDADYEGGEEADEQDEEEEAEMSAPELSGSEEDEEEAEQAEDIEDNGDAAVDEGAGNGIASMFDNEAEEEREIGEAETHMELAQDELSEVDLPIAYNKRRSNNRRVLDEDDQDESGTTGEAVETPSIPKAVKNPFAMANTSADDAPMGLTQAFAATMADSQIIDFAESQEQDSIAILRGMPGPDLSMFDGASQFQETQEISAGSPEINLHVFKALFNQDEVSSTQMPPNTQYSELPDPTQDGGFGMSSPVKSRFVPEPVSTIDTVVVSPVQVLESPVAKKKGRLHRRAVVVAAFSDDEEAEARSEADDADFEMPANAFDAMKKPAKKAEAAADAFDKKRSDAKKMVEEQAEESEDEYAGLGGASDDESGGEEDEEVKQMIDEGEVDVNERELAAFYADKERATDEKAVEKLFKDINNGMLRRKRGAEFDLTDSEDDIEDRRRRKRAKEQRMRNALLQNEKIGKIAEDPKKLAFIRAIEDHDDEEDDDDGDAGSVEGTLIDSQGMQSTQEVPESQLENADGGVRAGDEDTAGNNNNNNNSSKKRKRNVLAESDPPAGNRRAPPNLRRGGGREKKPTCLADIRASVSFLTEDPHEASRVAALSDEDECEGENQDGNGDAAAEKDNRSQDQGKEKDDSRSSNSTNSISAFASRHHHLRRNQSLDGSSTFIDRLSLMRSESADAAATANADGSDINDVSARLAFHDPTWLGSTPQGLRVPSLLRRATSQLSAYGTEGNGAGSGAGAGTGVTRSVVVTASIVGTERAAAGGGDAKGSGSGEFVRRGGTKRSSVNYFKREAQRQGAVGRVEKRREEGRRKVAEGRRGVLLSGLGAGRWE